MGDPRKPRKKYATPTKPWTKERVVEENELIKSYGLKNKTEIYKADSKLKKFLALAKRFATIRTKQDETEKELFLKKMKELGFLEKGEKDPGKVLDLKIKDILERRLQTIVHRKGLARSMKQARQFIIHRHIMIGERKITMPSVLVTTEDELKISFTAFSNLSKDDHPERVIIEKEEKKDKKKKKPVKRVRKKK